MEIDKIKLMAPKSIYWKNINDDIEKHISNCCRCLDFQQTQPKEKIILHKIPTKPLDIAATDMFTSYNRN